LDHFWQEINKISRNRCFAARLSSSHGVRTPGERLNRITVSVHRHNMGVMRNSFERSTSEPSGAEVLGPFLERQIEATNIDAPS
jgi:hypothetical protein